MKGKPREATLSILFCNGLFLEKNTNKISHRGEAALRKHLREHDQKAALKSDIRKRRNKARI